MFIVYAFIIFVISNGIGKFLLSKKEEIKILSVPVGFIVFMGGLQLGYYPMQIFQVSSTLVHTYTALISIPLFIYGIAKIKKEDFCFLKHYEFYILIILIFGIIKIIPATDAGDDSFYMPLIMENSQTDKINSINPRTGWNWNVDEFYKYQGYYLFQSSMYKLQNTLFHFTSDIFITFRTTMSLFVIISFAIIIYGIKSIYEIKDKTIALIITILSILLIGTLELSHLYWGSNLIFIIGIPIYLILLEQYTKNQQKKYVWIITGISLGLNAIASSSLFLQTFIIFSFFIYCLKIKNIKIYDYLIMMLPNIIYAILFLQKYWLIVPVILIYIMFLNKKVQEIVEKLLLKDIIYKLIFILPLVLFIIGIVLKLDFSWNIYRVGYGTLLANLLVILAIIYLYIKNRKIDVSQFIFFIYFIFFFNPLVAPFVSEFLTSKVVYYRLFYITKSPFMIITIFYSVYTYIEGKKKTLKYAYIIGVGLLIIRYGAILGSYTFLEPTYYTKYDYVLREDMDSKELGDFFTENQEKFKGQVVTSMYFSPRQYSLNYHANTYRYPYDEKYLNDEKDAYTIFLYNNDSVTEDDMYNFKNAMHKDKTKIVVTYTNKTQEMEKWINFNFDKIYQNKTYTVYYFNY